jgi:hypothetical protein
MFFVYSSPRTHFRVINSLLAFLLPRWRAEYHILIIEETSMMAWLMTLIESCMVRLLLQSSFPPYLLPLLNTTIQSSHYVISVVYSLFSSAVYVWHLSSVRACIKYRSLLHQVSLNEVFVYNFLLFFFISFRKIQKLDDSKSEKLEVTFHELLSFSLSASSSF